MIEEIAAVTAVIFQFRVDHRLSLFDLDVPNGREGNGLRLELFLPLDAEVVGQLSGTDGALRPIWQIADAIPAADH